MLPESFNRMEPTLVTPPRLAGILDELSSREPIFHRPELGTTRADFEKMTVDDFWELGASGRRYARSAVLGALEKRYATPRRRLGDNGFSLPRARDRCLPSDIHSAARP